MSLGFYSFILQGKIALKKTLENGPIGLSHLSGLFSALHFVKENKTLEDAIKFSGKANYSSIIFSVIKKCITINSHERM